MGLDVENVVYFPYHPTLQFGSFDVFDMGMIYVLIIQPARYPAPPTERRISAVSTLFPSNFAAVTNLWRLGDAHHKGNAT